MIQIASFRLEYKGVSYSGCINRGTLGRFWCPIDETGMSWDYCNNDCKIGNFFYQNNYLM